MSGVIKKIQGVIRKAAVKLKEDRLLWLKKKACILMLFGIFLFHMGVSYYVLQKSQIAYRFDESARIGFGYGLFQEIFDRPDMNSLDRGRLFLDHFSTLDEMQGHPHFFEIIESICWGILSLAGKMDVELMILFSNAFFLLILILATYGIGSILYGKRTGLLGAFLISMFPPVFGLSRVAMLDFPLMCMVSLCVYFLLRTDEFRSSIYSALFGLAAGLSVLTKEAGIFFIAGPLIYYFVKAYFLNQKKVSINFFAAVALFVAVLGSVYFRAENFGVYSTYWAKIGMDGSKPFFYYFISLKDFLGPYLLICSLPFFLNYFMNLKKRELILFFWFLIPLIMFSFSSNKALRFILPLAPAFAVIIAHEVMAINLPRMIRRASIFFLLVVSIVQFGLYNLGYLSYSEKNAWDCERGRLSVQRDPYAETVSDLFLIFDKEASAIIGNDQKKILFLFNMSLIHGPFGVRVLLSQSPFQVFCPLEADEVDILKSSWRGEPEEVLLSDYILDITPEQPVINQLPNRCKVEMGLKRGFAKYKDYFVKIAEVSLDDNSRIGVYKKK